MIKPIRSILVPVDFSDNTKIAVSKALEFCPSEFDLCTLHLLHVQKIGSLSFPFLGARTFSGYTRKQVNFDIDKSKAQLEQLKTQIELVKPVTVICWVSFGETVQESIIKKARQISADLIVIGKNAHHSVLPFLNTVVPSKLALCCRVPVLTAKRGSLYQEIKTVVVPVRHSFPEAKLDILAALPMSSRPNIKLVVFDEKGVEQSRAKKLLLSTFRAFKSRFSNPIDYETLDGSNMARSLLSYCNRIGADILIVYPGVETRIGYWWSSNLSDMLPAESKTQILAVTPK